MTGQVPAVWLTFLICENCNSHKTHNVALHKRKDKCA